jgi:hypothetical protein
MDEDLSTHNVVEWKVVRCPTCDVVAFEIPDGYDCGTAEEQWNRRRDYAIEFGEYLADAAEQFMDATNALSQARMLSDFGAATTAELALTDAWRGLKSAIYEFRGRAVRARGAGD